MTRTPSLTVRGVVAALDAAYPPQLAESWDSVGLICGNPDATVTTVLFAVDPVRAVVDEALLLQADMIVTHHPLLLTGVHSVAATNAKGRILHDLISHGISLFSAHTNADNSSPGVSDALAEALGLTDLRALAPVDEAEILGSGRVGRLTQDVSLEQFAELVGASLPETWHGVRVAGDPMQAVRTVAVCGGAGDSLLHRATQVADVYVTADLRHHRALDHMADSGCALIDVAHWASEWPWLEHAARALTAAMTGQGASLRTIVSTIPTDPWNFRVLAPPSRGSTP